MTAKILGLVSDGYATVAAMLVTLEDNSEDGPNESIQCRRSGSRAQRNDNAAIHRIKMVLEYRRLIKLYETLQISIVSDADARYFRCEVLFNLRFPEVV